MLQLEYRKFTAVYYIIPKLLVIFTCYYHDQYIPQLITAIETFDSKLANKLRAAGFDFNRIETHSYVCNILLDLVLTVPRVTRHLNILIFTCFCYNLRLRFLLIDRLLEQSLTVEVGKCPRRQEELLEEVRLFHAELSGIVNIANKCFGNLATIFVSILYFHGHYDTFYCGNPVLNSAEGLLDDLNESYELYLVAYLPALIIRDPELIKHILLKEFHHFTDRFATADEKIDPMGGKNIFLIKGSRWRHLRSNLSTTFSSGKLKRMFPLIVKCAQDLRDYVGENGSSKDNPLDVKDVMARSAIDVIASCMYGIDSGALREPRGEFRKFSKNVFAFSPKRAIEMLAFFFTPGLIRFVKGMFFQRHSDKFLRGAFTEAVKERETGESFRNDLVDVLLSLKRKKLEEKEIKGITKKKDTEELKTIEYTDEDLVAQAVIFFTAGFETTSITTGFALYELAMNPQVQKKLREQIGQVLDIHDGHITYEAIRDMKYLDMVLSETLRMYPPLPFLDRNCAKDFTIPGTDIVIEKNTPVYIPTLGMHRDPILFPEPLKFRPERFDPENKESIHRFSYLPFGEGPHMCIGMRFGLLAAKTELVHLLSSWEVAPCAETPRTMVLSPYVLFLRNLGKIPLLFREVQLPVPDEL
uniref:Cytochrome P450 n=1 Tax=Timema poppense TaxID=170557 RepID=A0A7R9D7Q7_TIMPO|nr:unnamed protein product [Timema poppensis]